MAYYNNSYAFKVTPKEPNLRGLQTNYDNSGQKDIGGIGLGDLFQLDYDRDKIENIFNQGTDAQYALMQKENQIAQNNYANNQFANQQSALETLRQQRNSQIASGMAKGLNAAQEQGTVLGLQQEASQGALDLANQQQLEADKIAVEYANNVKRALQESNAVKEAVANISAQLYEADMMGYTGELSSMAQLDANASDRYGYDIGLEGTKYTADKNLEAAIKSAQISAAASAAASAGFRGGYGGGGGRAPSGLQDNRTLLDKLIADGQNKGLTGDKLVNFVGSGLALNGQGNPDYQKIRDYLGIEPPAAAPQGDLDWLPSWLRGPTADDLNLFHPHYGCPTDRLPIGLGINAGIPKTYLPNKSSTMPTAQTEEELKKLIMSRGR